MSLQTLKHSYAIPLIVLAGLAQAAPVSAPSSQNLLLRSTKTGALSREVFTRRSDAFMPQGNLFSMQKFRLLRPLSALSENTEKNTASADKNRQLAEVSSAVWPTKQLSAPSTLLLLFIGVIGLKLAKQRLTA